MKVTEKKTDLTTERLIVTGLIVSEDFTKTIRPIFKSDLLNSTFAKTVSGWCISYYDEYGTVPNRTIEDLYNAKEHSLDDNTAIAIEKFLDSISKEYDRTKFNYKYYCKVSEKYLRSQNLKSLYNRGRAYLNNDQLEKAEIELNSFDQVRIIESEGFDLFRDAESFRTLLDSLEKNVVFRFKGEVGRIISDSSRGELFAFSGPEKRGKSWWLMEIAVSGLLDGCNVIIFSLELTYDQYKMRLGMYLTGRPSKYKHLNCEIPYLKRGNEIAYRKSEKPLLDGFTIEKKIKSLKPMARTGTLKLVCWPPGTHSISDINSHLSMLEASDGFIADIIIIDHGDRLKPLRHLNEVRHGIDAIWEDMKGLAMERFALVASATHSKIETTKKRITQATASAEDKRKSGHVDRLIGLNQTAEEKKAGLMRLNNLYDRVDESASHIDVVVLQQLKIGRVYLDSYIEEVESDSDRTDRTERIRKRRQLKRRSKNASNR
jgi:hypothetical protein